MSPMTDSQLAAMIETHRRFEAAFAKLGQAENAAQAREHRETLERELTERKQAAEAAAEAERKAAVEAFFRRIKRHQSRRRRR